MCTCIKFTVMCRHTHTHIYIYIYIFVYIYIYGSKGGECSQDPLRLLKLSFEFLQGLGQEVLVLCYTSLKFVVYSLQAYSAYKSRWQQNPNFDDSYLKITVSKGSEAVPSTLTLLVSLLPSLSLSAAACARVLYIYT